jgi:hypothetical protein
MRFFPREFWYKIKCRFFHKYSTIKARYLDHTWNDRSYLLPHLMFEVLSQFIDEECSPGHIDWYGEFPHIIKVDGVDKNVMDEMKDLYAWFHIDYIKAYPAEQAVLMDQVHKIDSEFLISEFQEIEGSTYFSWDPQYKNPEAKEQVTELFKQYSQIEKDYELELNKRLHRLVEVIPFMWT